MFGLFRDRRSLDEQLLEISEHVMRTFASRTDLAHPLYGSIDALSLSAYFSALICGRQLDENRREELSSRILQQAREVFGLQRLSGDIQWHVNFAAAQKAWNTPGNLNAADPFYEWRTEIAPWQMSLEEYHREIAAMDEVVNKRLYKRRRTLK